MSNPEQPGYPGPGGENPYGAPQQPNPYGQPQQPQYQQQPPYPQYQQNPYQQQPWQQPSGYPPYQIAPPNESLATPALVIGIVSLVLTFACGIGALGSPAAMIMGKVSMNRIDRSNGQLGGRGAAMAGFILGIVGTVLLVLAIIALVLFVTVGVYSDSSTS
jgi:hypothetical protein